MSNKEFYLFFGAFLLLFAAVFLLNYGNKPEKWSAEFMLSIISSCF